MRKKRLTKKQKLEAIADSGGVLKTIAKRAGVDRRTVHNWRDADADIRRAIDDEREQLIDAAEMTLRDAVAAGDVNAAKFVCATLGRDRGYSRRTEIEGHVHATGQVVITIPDNQRESNATNFDTTDPPAKITKASG